MLVELLNIISSTGCLYPEICDFAMIQSYFHHSRNDLEATINTAKNKGFVVQSGNEYALTEKGKKRIR